MKNRGVLRSIFWAMLFVVVVLILVAPKNACAVPMQWAIGSGGNGHYYDIIFEGVDWNTARANASASSYLGMSGYLATITSAAENSFILSTFDPLTDSYGWIGGNDVAVEGMWRWADGPEAGIQFSQGTIATPPFNYVNWAAAEPDNAGGVENWAVFQFGNSASVPNGKWGDDPLNGAGQVGVYIVEFSEIPEPATGTLLFLGFALFGGRRVRCSPMHRLV